ncbi:hypothetical protein VTL71DRAFT_3715 [Oculimacula yallundae]|uniref:Uncharacterized protein n=1 Tax=Oculimacula yallundae TaxID=86028 RepID=A0ABR4C3W5_9HELO
MISRDLLTFNSMQRTNDNDLMLDMDRLVLTNSAKPEGVDITKLPPEEPAAPGLSSKSLNGSKYRSPQGPFLYRKKPVVRQNLKEFMAHVPNNEQGAIAVDTSLAVPVDFSFLSPMEGTVSTIAIGRFPNITNPAPYVGPNYRHRDILAANPNPLTHCRNKEAKEKCPACLLHDFKICEARLKEANIKLVDAKALIELKVAKLSDKLKKRITEWEGERNLFGKQMQDKMNEWDAKRNELIKKIEAERNSKDEAIAAAVKKSEEDVQILIDGMEQEAAEILAHKNARIEALENELLITRGNDSPSTDHSVGVRSRGTQDQVLDI